MVAAVFASKTAPKVWLDPSNGATRFQDFAGSTQASTPGQAVGRLVDASGAGNHVGQAVGASCPLYQIEGAVSYLQFDGSNDSLYSLANLDLTSTNKLTLVVGRRASTSAATSMLVEFGANATSVNGTFSLASPSTGVAGRVGVTARGTAPFTLTYDNASLPRSEVITLLIDLSTATRSVVLRINGVEVGVGNVGLGGSFISDLLNLGRRANASLPLNGGITGVELIGALTTSDELNLLERYMASKTFASGVMP